MKRIYAKGVTAELLKKIRGIVTISIHGDIMLVEIDTRELGVYVQHIYNIDTLIVSGLSSKELAERIIEKYASWVAKRFFKIGNQPKI